MQDITVLELQIAKELEELDRIQGVLKTMGQSEEGYPENPLKVVSKQARKSPVPRRKNNKIQESVENEKNDYDSLHEFIMLEREQELMSKDESSKSKMNLKPKNDRNLQNRNLNLPPRSSLAKIKPTTQLDEERIDPDFSKLVLSSKHNRDKSVADIGHEEYEKMCQKFREARMNTKNFDERIRLLMIEKENKELMREVIRKAKESEKEAKALQECTFTPKKIPTHNKSRSKDQSLLEEKSSVYERNIMWEAERQNKLERVRVEREQKVEKCSFKPTTTPQRPVSTIEYPRELKESSFIQEGLASHYHRMGKSRSKSPTRPKSPANNNNINTSRSSVHRRLSGGSGRQLHIDERAEQRKSVEYKRHRLGEALKQKYLLRRVYQHDS